MISDEEKRLASMYGPAAPFSEHKRGDHITYINGKGQVSKGSIIWVQARFANIPIKYVILPDGAHAGAIDFILPGDVLTVTQDEQEQTLVRCPWCGQHHPIEQVKHCPLKPKKMR